MIKAVSSPQKTDDDDEIFASGKASAELRSDREVVLASFKTLDAPWNTRQQVFKRIEVSLLLLWHKI